MPNFIDTRDGYVNLDRVEKITRTVKGESILYGKDRAVLGVVVGEIENHIAQLLPCDGWEKLTWIAPVDVEPSWVFACPVIAWGLTLNNTIGPVTADEAYTFWPSQREPWGLRKVGGKEIFMSDDVTFPDAESWAADMQKRHERQVAKKAGN